MHAAAERLEFAPPPTPGLLRALALAILAHAALVAALTWGVQWKRSDTLTSAQAELWASVPQQAAPPPPPPPPPQTVTPTPPPPVQATPPAPDPAIAIEREKQRLKKEKQLAAERAELDKREQQRKLAEKQRELDKQKELDKRKLAEQKKAALEAQAKVDQKVQLEQAKRAEAERKANIDKMRQQAGQAGSSGTPSSTGTALQSAGPSASYAGRVIGRVRPNIVYTEVLATNPEAVVEVRTAPDGAITGRKLVKSSGIKSWDEAVLKAIDKSETLPRDTDGRVPPVLEISFRPRD